MPESPVVSFYRGTGSDHRGRRLEEILTWNDAELESVHDYIQWLFPNDVPSRANSFAPLLTADDRATFRADPALRATLQRCFLRILSFYGLERVEQGDTLAIRPSNRWTERAPTWLNPHNHNHLRLSRIMKCLKALGLEEEARALQRTLMDLAERTHVKAVARTTVKYWRTALE